MTTARHTLHLVERTPRVVRLGRSDVDHLLAHHRGRFELSPTGDRGRYRLTALGYVGVVLTLGRRFVIRPKLPVRNLFHLIDPDADVPIVEDRSSAETGRDLLDLLAGQLARLLSERAGAGLLRSYRERDEALPFLQGRLDVAAQLREPAHARDRFHCRHDEFGVDVLCNQLPKATAEALLRSPLLGESPRAALVQVLRAFGEVSAAPLSAEAFAAALADPRAADYRPLLHLCRLLAGGLQSGDSVGPDACPGFLIDMERLFEDYLTRGLLGHLAGRPGLAVEVQPLTTVHPPGPALPPLQMRPDIVVRRAGRPAVIVDAKWKRLTGSPLVTSDVYQVIAYGTALGARRVVLVYPGRRDRRWVYPLSESEMRVEVRMLRVIGGRAQLADSLRRLARSVGAGSVDS
jgi:5-methylcytosine-specific restriction enzyme subunit McrC